MLGNIITLLLIQNLRMKYFHLDILSQQKLYLPLQENISCLP